MAPSRQCLDYVLRANLLGSYLCCAMESEFSQIVLVVGEIHDITPCKSRRIGLTGARTSVTIVIVGILGSPSFGGFGFVVVIS